MTNIVERFFVNDDSEQIQFEGNGDLTVQLLLGASAPLSTPSRKSSWLPRHGR